MRSEDAIREEIADLRDAQARDTARLSQLLVEIEALRGEQEGIAVRAADTAQRLDALQRTLAVLEDHAPTTPEPAPEPEIEVEALPPAAVDSTPRPPSLGANPGRYAKDPMKVLPKSGMRKRAGHGAGAKRTPLYEATDLGIDLAKLSPTDTARAQVIFEYIEAEGTMSQADLAVAIGEWFECEPGTAASLVSRGLKVLLAQGRIVYTNEKAVTPSGRRDSPIWRIK